MKRSTALTAALALTLTGAALSPAQNPPAPPPAPASSAPPEIVAEIKAKTKQFTEAIVSKDLSVLDKMFESQAGNVYYDINEGPLLTFDRLKRVWTAATTNFTISKFDFNDDMKIDKVGDVLVQTGTWAQTQVAKSGASRDIVGRVTVLWRRTGNEWRVFHYHGSITPPRPAAPPRPPVSPTAAPQPPF
ncbi:MAG: nuclear transport factor 2 family protein [Vicinamibacteria bacterium]|nr:nuclear transport factor 2 family protein [Vicinamibacteria bacterium]